MGIICSLFILQCIGAVGTRFATYQGQCFSSFLTSCSGRSKAPPTLHNKASDWTEAIYMFQQSRSLLIYMYNITVWKIGPLHITFNTLLWLVSSLYLFSHNVSYWIYNEIKLQWNHIIIFHIEKNQMLSRAYGQHFLISEMFVVMTVKTKCWDNIYRLFILN